MTKEQCAKMLLPTATTMPKGNSLARNHHGSFPFIGDLVDKTRGWLLSCRDVGEFTADEVDGTLRELTGNCLRTHFDNRTAQAYMEAKEALDKGASPETAWPEWYHHGEDPPHRLCE